MDATCISHRTILVTLIHDSCNFYVSDPTNGCLQNFEKHNDFLVSPRHIYIVSKTNDKTKRDSSYRLTSNCNVNAVVILSQCRVYTNVYHRDNL